MLSTKSFSNTKFIKYFNHHLHINNIRHSSHGYNGLDIYAYMYAFSRFIYSTKFSKRGPNIAFLTFQIFFARSVFMKYLLKIFTLFG
jgi:hypothetical protein